MANYVNAKYSVFVSSGSTANTLLAMYLKDTLNRKNKNIIIFPSTTWTTSISPFLREGFLPKFIDICLDDFCLDLDATEKYLIKNHKKVAAIVCVSLIGQVPNIEKLKHLEKKYNVRILLDNCENTLGSYCDKNISSYFTSTTSTYFGHQLQSVEGGFIFTNSQKEYEYFLMNRNHGMTRSLITYDLNPKTYNNPDVDQAFDFFSLGNNFRNSDINAFIGLLDFKRIKEYTNKRIKVYNDIRYLFKNKKIILPINFENRKAVPFCFPFVSKDKNFIESLKEYCRNKGIETRPIISGNLLKQTCYKQYGKSHEFINSEFLHNNGFYIGIYPTIKNRQIKMLEKFIK